jgi:hypothetical protein
MELVRIVTVYGENRIIITTTTRKHCRELRTYVCKDGWKLSLHTKCGYHWFCTPTAYSPEILKIRNVTLNELTSIGYKLSGIGGYENCWKQGTPVLYEFKCNVKLDVRSVDSCSERLERWPHNYMFYWISLLRITWNNSILNGSWQGMIHQN